MLTGNFLDFLESKELVGLERLFNQIYYIESYNQIIRPVEYNTTLTLLNTELKLLQIDLDEK
jgi:hypothetical protein